MNKNDLLQMMSNMIENLKGVDRCFGSRSSIWLSLFLNKKYEFKFFRNLGKDIEHYEAGKQFRRLVGQRQKIMMSINEKTMFKLISANKKQIVLYAKELHFNSLCNNKILNHLMPFYFSKWLIENPDKHDVFLDNLLYLNEQESLNVYFFIVDWLRLIQNDYHFLMKQERIHIKGLLKVIEHFECAKKFTQLFLEAEKNKKLKHQDELIVQKIKSIQMLFDMPRKHLLDYI